MIFLRKRRRQQERWERRGRGLRRRWDQEHPAQETRNKTKKPRKQPREGRVISQKKSLPRLGVSILSINPCDWFLSLTTYKSKTENKIRVKEHAMTWSQHQAPAPATTPAVSASLGVRAVTEEQEDRGERAGDPAARNTSRNSLPA